MVNDILMPMNHREIEYNAKKLSGCNIPDSFLCADVKSSSTDCTCDMDDKANKTILLKWLDETGKRVFDEDLIMDYGIDCLRLYLLFEQTPREKDAPYYYSWQEGALEGIYKFLNRYRRMILVADVWNRSGKYNEITLSAENICRLKEALESTNQKIKNCIDRGNTMSNRHKIVSSLMELLNLYQKELKIGAIVTKLRAHAVEMAVPHGGLKQNFALEPKEEQAQNPEVTVLCQKFIALMAPYAPNLSIVLWTLILLE